MVKPLQGTSDPIIFREIDKHGACPVQHMKGLRHMATKTAKTTKPVKTVKAKITAATKVRTKGSEAFAIKATKNKLKVNCRNLFISHLFSIKTLT